MIPSTFPLKKMIEPNDLKMLKEKYSADGVVITLEYGDGFYYRGMCADGNDLVTGFYDREDLEDEL